MKIDHIYIGCYRHDVRFTRILVASIRYWYPDIPISIIKDYLWGAFDTSDIENEWNVSVLDIGGRSLGQGFNKLEPIFAEGEERILHLDSDIAMVGPALDTLEKYDEDIIVQKINSPSPRRLKKWYFDLERLKEFDPNFKFPGYLFNFGQFVINTGSLKKDDFGELMDVNVIPTYLYHPDIFFGAEMGIFNYVVLKKLMTSQLSVKNIDFAISPKSKTAADISISKLARNSPYKYLIHWEGLASPRMKSMPRSDILLYFEDRYYQNIEYGQLKKLSRAIVWSIFSTIRFIITKEFPKLRLAVIKTAVFLKRRRRK